MFKHCALYIDCISEVNNIQVGNAKELDVVVPMYNLIQNSNNCSKTSGSLRQYCRDEPDHTIADSNSFKFKSRFLNNSDNTGTAYIETAVPLKYVSNIWRTLEMPLFNC